MMDLRQLSRSSSREIVDKMMKIPSISECNKCNSDVEGTYKYITNLFNTLKFSWAVG